MCELGGAKFSKASLNLDKPTTNPRRLPRKRIKIVARAQVLFITGAYFATVSEAKMSTSLTPCG